MMRSRHFLDNLRFKVGVGVILPLALVLGLFSYLQYVSHREREIQILEQSATNLGQIVEGSLRYAMLQHDFAAAQQIIDDLAHRGDVENILLLNAQNQIRFASGGRGIGTRLSRSDPGCQGCHLADTQLPQASAIVVSNSGRRVLRNCSLIKNEPACAECHDSGNRITGVIITDLSATEVDRRLSQELRDTLLFFGGALILGALVTNLLINKVVVSRLVRVAQAVRVFGQGDFRSRAEMSGGDEIARLAIAFNQMAQGLQEKAGLEQRVRTQAEELRRISEERGHLLERTITAQEEERKRIARELHDEWAQTLAALTVNLDQASKALPEELAWHREQLERTHAVTVDAVKALRRLILDLRPAMLDDLGLIPAIRWYAESRLETNGMMVEFHASGLQRRLSPAVETALFRISQEAITNIAKHAQASQATIHLEFQTDRVALSIQDDGRGFDVGGVLRGEGLSRGLGLLGMRERATLLGGILHIRSRPSRGTRIQVEVPVDGAEGR